MKKTKWISIIAICMVMLLVLPNDAHAFNASCNVSANTSRCNPGDVVTVTANFWADDTYALEWWISCSNGQQYHDYQPTCNGTVSVTKQFNANVEGNNTVTVTSRVVSYNVDVNTMQTTEKNPSASCGFYVVTAADIAAAEESRRQQESINASIAASQAVEQSIAASQYAESSKAQQEIDDSIAAEQASIQESEAAIEESINASIAESASIEESIIQESLSIEESIEQSSLAVAESISESESEVERTKAVQIGSISYVPFKNGRNKFMFAAEDTELGVPEGFEKTDLMVNTQYVWAYRDADMEAHTYLVYGRFEKDDESQYYFYDETNGTFFQYGKLHAEEADLPILTTPVEAMQVEKKSGISGGILALLCAVSLLAGAGIAVLVMMYLKNRSLNSGMIAVAADDDEDFVQDEYSGEITESGELILVDTSGGESWYGLAIAPGSK